MYSARVAGGTPTAGKGSGGVKYRAIASVGIGQIPFRFGFISRV
jgi:hypothetical protein